MARNPAYEDENDLLRLKVAELESKVHTLDDEIDEIMVRTLVEPRML